ncbi:hypothetical protein C8A00DRAFT_41146 [Chaetomidium leptoderma]|uniref:F-box domain-containing protein n=1 Tax=Chaetomidium leptoderma TaxID=669021 RepID=A0AAN7A126_9PEZI|nr:hypothetical protein C8A00DRAFT_41146 [Chaetomidium leptoderma]
MPSPAMDLPSEIWMMILERLPPSFFQQDIRRLALCKRWYSLAFPTFYPRIEFTPRVLSRLVHRKSASLDKSRAQLRKSLRRVNIVLEGLGPPAGPLVSGGGGGGGGDPKLACFNTHSNLARFCLMLLEFRELKAVRFAARWQNRDWRADPLQVGYLCTRNLEPYISLLTNVTELDLDLCGTDVSDEIGTGEHFCEHLRGLLSRLTTLRLRMRSICHYALWPLEGRPVTLGELTLSLYLGNVSDHNPKLNSSKSCPASHAWEWESPMDQMRARMRALVKDMAEPRRAEMVHLAPSGEVHVWDASTGVCVRDESEKPRQFSNCIDSQRGSCFSPNADDWEWDDMVGIGGIFTSYNPGDAGEVDANDGGTD